MMMASRGTEGVRDVRGQLLEVLMVGLGFVGGLGMLFNSVGTVLVSSLGLVASALVAYLVSD